MCAKGLSTNRPQIFLDMFLRPADEDYLVARWSLRTGLTNQFCWSSLQAIEKLLKCNILLFGTSILFQGKNTHNLEKLFQRAVETIPEFQDSNFDIPDGFPDWALEQADFNEKTSGFVSRVNKYGSPSQRYREVGHFIHSGDLHKLDATVFHLRQLAVNSSKWKIEKTLHEYESDNFYPVPKTFFDAKSYRPEFSDRNFAFFPNRAAFESKVLMIGSIQPGQKELSKDAFFKMYPSLKSEMKRLIGWDV